MSPNNEEVRVLTEVELQDVSGGELAHDFANTVQRVALFSGGAVVGFLTELVIMAREDPWA